MSLLYLFVIKVSFKIVVLFIISCYLDLKKFKIFVGIVLRLDILEIWKIINEVVINLICCR